MASLATATAACSCSQCPGIPKLPFLSNFRRTPPFPLIGGKGRATCFTSQRDSKKSNESAAPLCIIFLPIPHTLLLLLITRGFWESRKASRKTHPLQFL
ncbi:hypothetical protein NC652_020952 [Populus alba x Populus x berolinensis]|nr:hypothetical protein NC652_020952 [Populus alba x Populus x berolinensis]